MILWTGFAFSWPHTYTLGLNAKSTVNNCVGFDSGVLANSYTSQTGTSAIISTTITRGVITITLNQTDSLNFTDHTDPIKLFKFLQMQYNLVQI